MHTAASTRLKQRNQRRAQLAIEETMKRRRGFMIHITTLCYEEALSVCREFSGNDADQTLFQRVTVSVVHSYCNMLINEGIQLQPGQYEPHAMFFRTHAVKYIMYLMTGTAETDPDGFMKAIAGTIVEMSKDADKPSVKKKSLGYLANVAMVGSLGSFSKVKP
jgi:hypothetical protein